MKKSFSPRRNSNLTLELIILWIVSEIALTDLKLSVEKDTNSKHQITNKSQIPISNDQTFKDGMLFGFSHFGHWLLFDIWDLIFIISASQ